MSDQNPAYFGILPANVRYDNDLTSSQKLFFTELTVLMFKKGYCFASNSHFANLYNVSPSTISRWIKGLSEKGYIAVKYVRSGKQIKERQIYPLVDKYSGASMDKVLHKDQGGIVSMQEGYCIDVKDNNTSNNNTSNNNNAREENKEFTKPKNSESKEKSCDKKEKFDPSNVTDDQHSAIKNGFTMIWKEKYPKWISRGVYEKDNFIRIACDIGRYLKEPTLADVLNTFKKIINNPPEYMTQQTPKSVYNNLNLYFQNLETKPNGKRKFSIKEAYEALERNE